MAAAEDNAAAGHMSGSSSSERDTSASVRTTTRVLRSAVQELYGPAGPGLTGWDEAALQRSEKRFRHATEEHEQPSQFHDLVAAATSAALQPYAFLDTPQVESVLTPQQHWESSMSSAAAVAASATEGFFGTSPAAIVRPMPVLAEYSGAARGSSDWAPSPGAELQQLQQRILPYSQQQRLVKVVRPGGDFSALPRPGGEGYVGGGAVYQTDMGRFQATFEPISPGRPAPAFCGGGGGMNSEVSVRPEIVN